MNRIEEMIKEMCPDGVRRVRLGEVCKYVCSGGTPSTKNQSYYGGDIPWLRTQEVDWKDIYDTEIKITQKAIENSSAKLIPANCIIVAMYGATAAKACINRIPLTTNQACCNLEINDKFANMKFVYYCICFNYEFLKGQGEGSQNNLNAQKIKNLQIPLPPLPIQQEIVKILDSFTALQQNLEDELKLRQKQYEHYREKLLTFEDGEVEWKKIGEIFVFKNGLNKGKEYFGHGGPIINYTDVYHNIGITKETPKGTVQLTNSEIERFSVKKGDVFFTRTSETSEEVGIASVLLEDIENCTFSGFLLRARPIDESFIPEYCKYCFSSYDMRRKIINSSSCTTRATTTGTILSSLTIPVPNKEKQSQIVQTLDHFETLISNIKTEIELRKKQYEYYREKLLTF